MELGPGYEIYLTPVTSQHLSACVLGALPRLPNVSESLRLVLETSKDLGFEATRIESQQGVGPLGNLQRQAVFKKVLLVGDACESMDPLAGMGMTHAIVSAECAAQALIPFFRGRSASLESSFMHYNYAREREARKLRRLTQLTYHSLKTPEVFRPIELLAYTPLPRYMTSFVHGK